MMNVSYGWAIKFLSEMNPEGNPDPTDVGMAIEKILSMETINATPKKALLNALRYCASVMHLKEWAESNELLPRKEERRLAKWIPFVTRPMTEEELEEYSSYLGIDIDAIDREEAVVFTCDLPEDGQEVLITNLFGDILIDKCERDDFIGFEENGDMDGYLAWMPLPEPYRKEVLTDDRDLTGCDRCPGGDLPCD